jgi:CRISPR-associated endonuclease/helicase Cas3
MEWVDSALRVIGKPTLSEGELSQLCRQAEVGSWWVAGTAVLADWIGSNTRWFPYEDRQMPLMEYWRRSLRQAEQAVTEAGIVPAGSAPQMHFGDLWTGRLPSPSQQLVAEMPANEPACVVIEDVMGAGKTEAALLLAHRLIAQGQADGLFWALPTMATANALFDRIAPVYLRLFSSATSITLAHSKRKLVEFSGGDETASDRASAWLSEDNRRGLLAQVGVGTIDQVLMGALHTRHNTLRLVGLLGKVLIVDEVHACDAYMRRVLCVLIELHARAGGSVILLSATLPLSQRQELINAWQHGRGKEPAILSSRRYPLVTRIGSEDAAEWPIDTRAGLHRTIRVIQEHEIQAVVREIVRAARSGLCVVWIRNTVTDAIQMYEALRTELGDQVDLFHARFTLADRLAIEQRVLNRFGPRSRPADRSGQVLVATQVVEQSIDLDFDFMVSDVAPIDLLLQRVGRLHRHARGERGQPVLMVHGPLPEVDAGSDWLRAVLPGTAAVYDDHGALWLGTRAITRVATFQTPGAARTLVDEVYESDAEDSMPEELARVHQRALGNAAADRAKGRANAISLTGSYEVDGPDWWRDEYTPTRLGEPTVTFAIGVFDGQRIGPINRTADFPWERSSVTVRETSLREGRLPLGANQASAAIEVGRWRRLLVLTPDGDAFSGEGIRGREQIVTVRYDRQRGLTWDIGR